MDLSRQPGHPLVEAWGVQPAWHRDLLSFVFPVPAAGAAAVRGGAAALGEEDRRQASRARADADREAARLEELARRKAAADRIAAARERRRATGRAATILTSPLGLSGLGMGLRPTLG